MSAGTRRLARKSVPYKTGSGQLRNSYGNFKFEIIEDSERREFRKAVSLRYPGPGACPFPNRFKDRSMAGKPQNRLELRRQYEAAEPLDPMEDEAEEVGEDVEEEETETRRPRKKKAPAKSKATKAAKPAARMRVVWAVVNDAFKPVATFEYSQKEAAHTRAAELTAKGKGTHFVQ